MKPRFNFTYKGILVAFILLLLSMQTVFSQDALTSVKYLVRNVQLSANQKTISYDVYLKDVDPDYSIAVPGYTFRLMIPQADLGDNEKIVSVTNGSAELGVSDATMTVCGSNWLMKFNQASIALKYSDALLLSSVGDGTLIGTFHISNRDGSSFPKDLSFRAVYSGTSITKKSIVGILQPNTVVLAANSTTAQPESNTIGLGVYNLGTTGFNQISEDYLTLYPNPTVNGFNINVGERSCVMHIFDMQGKKLMSQTVSGISYVDISSFLNGAYWVEVNGVSTKLIKK